MTQPPNPARIFVLDQNFPLQAVAIPWPSGMQLQALAAINPALTRGVDDWEILRQLHLGASVAGFITNDARMLDSSREMVVLGLTNLVLVVCDRVGHNPLKATGLVMVHAADIANLAEAGPLTLRLSPRGIARETPGQRVDRIAERIGQLPQELTRAELAELKKLLGSDEYARLRSGAG